VSQGWRKWWRQRVELLPSSELWYRVIRRARRLEPGSFGNAILGTGPVMLNEVKHLGVAPRRPRHAERSEASRRCAEILRFAQDDGAEDDGFKDEEAEAASSC